jgi:uncharacterized membrane protein
MKTKNPMAFLSYLSILVVVPFLTDAKNDPFVKYHLKQGLVLLIFEVVGWFVAGLIGFIPLLGWLIVELWWLADVVLVIIGLVNVANGKEKELPIIGQYGEKFTF